MYVSPAVVGPNLYIGSCSGTCYALDRNTGGLIWRNHLGELSFHGNPVVADSMLIVPTDGRPGSIYALSLLDGTLVWQHSVPGKSDHRTGVTTDLFNRNQVVFGVSTFDKLIALDMGTGDQLWEFAGSFEPEGSYRSVTPAVSDSVIYFMSFDGWLHCIDPDSGREVWKSEIGARPSTSMSLLEGHIFVGCIDSTLYKLSCENGRILNKLKLDAMPRMQLCVVDSMIYMLSENVPDVYGTRNFMSVNGKRLEVHWEAHASYQSRWTIKRATPYRDWIVSGNARGEILLMDPRTGQTAKSLLVEGRVRSIAFDNDVMFIGTIEGMIHAVQIDP